MLLFVFFLMYCSFLPFFTVLPFFYDMNSTTWLHIQHMTNTVFIVAYIAFNTFYSVIVVSVLLGHYQSSKNASRLRRQAISFDDEIFRTVAVKALIHTGCSSIGGFCYGFIAAPYGLILYDIFVVFGIHANVEWSLASQRNEGTPTSVEMNEASSHEASSIQGSECETALVRSDSTKWRISHQHSFGITQNLNWRPSLSFGFTTEVRHPSDDMPAIPEEGRGTRSSYRPT